MAKSRAQRKAEQRKKREQDLAARARRKQDEAAGASSTPAPGVTGGAGEFDAAIEAGAEAADQIAETPAPAPSRADIGTTSDADAESGTALSRREQRRLQKEEARKAKESAERRAPKEAKVEKERGAVMGFFASVISELRRVQWPNRDTLVQASAVTLLFVAVAATYLGILDAIFGELVDLFIT